jgi:N-acyl-D-aspartate/D-glutamate deacylase
VHGMTNKEQEYQVRDGVTTAMELEGGKPFLQSWYKSRESVALINYGAAASWSTARLLALKKNEALKKKLQALTDYSELAAALYLQEGSSYDSLAKDEIPAMLATIETELAAGGLGIALPIGYYPGAQPEEDFRIFQLAARMQVPVFSHVREGGFMAIQEAISNAMLTKAPLHIVHMNSMALKDIALGIEMVQTAQKNGYDITTEMYPYTAASTGLGSALFDGGWQENFNISYGDLQWVATGERLTEQTFNEYRLQGGTVIIHMMKPEWIRAGLRTEGTIIASDGMPYSKLAHPRTAGTFSRVLGKYVREEQILTLNDALKKMTLLPAQRMELITPSMKKKGRIQVGADADITIFDADKIIDKATFDGGLEFSEGVEFVLVNGVLIVRNGETVLDTFPGKPVYGKLKK